MNDIEFLGANQVYDGMLKKLKREGFDCTQHKPAIADEDMCRFYETGTLSNDNPVALQHKVFLEVALHFGRRGNEGWRALKKDSFEKKVDPKGREYITLKFQEFDKNHANAELKNQCMYATDDPDMCPVQSFDLYISKLNEKCDAFLQRPAKNYEGRTTWYDNAPVGKNKIAEFMKEISRKSGASRLYTNHCIKASTATVLKKAGVPAQDIMSVTGHRNVASLASYAEGPNYEDRAKMSSILASFGKSNTSNNDAVIPTTSVASTSSVEIVSNENRLTCDSMSDLFRGAHFHGNVTINFQVNK
jgi:hypothetical protein